jgi:putative addiction module component (TIGR02574 family)
VTKAAQELLADALRLDTTERAKLAAELLASLDGEPEEDVEAAWAEEVERRMDEIESGAVKLVPWEDVKRRVEKEILQR